MKREKKRTEKRMMRFGDASSFFVRSGKSVILLFVVVSIDRTAVLCDGVLCSRGIVKIL